MNAGVIGVLAVCGVLFFFNNRDIFQKLSGTALYGFALIGLILLGLYYAGRHSWQNPPSSSPQQIVSNPSRAKSDPSNQEANQKRLVADGLDDKSIERRRIECEPLKPLLDQFAYLEAGFTQGINQNDFIEAQRRVEAEYIKLGAGSDPNKTEWANDSRVPEKLRLTFSAARTFLGIIKIDWRAKSQGLVSPDIDDPSKWMETAAKQMKRAREETATYIQKGD